MSDWTEAQIKAVLAESATEERRKAYGLSPGNLARLILDVRHELDETKRPFCGCGDSIEPQTDALCGNCAAIMGNDKDSLRKHLIEIVSERDAANEKLRHVHTIFKSFIADLGDI